MLKRTKPRKRKIGTSVQRCLLLAFLLSVGHVASAQSGRGLMHGYVAFEGVSYDDVLNGAVQAKVELLTERSGPHTAYEAQTNEHGSYDFRSVAMGEYVLRISAPGYAGYEAKIYIPSDFECKLAVMLKHEEEKPVPTHGH